MVFSIELFTLPYFKPEVTSGCCSTKYWKEMAQSPFSEKHHSHKKNQTWWPFVKVAAIDAIVTKMFNASLPHSQRYGLFIHQMHSLNLRGT